MSASNVFETDILKLIFNGSTISKIADNTVTSPATNLYVSLHTNDPGEGGFQNTSEATFTSYARVAVLRTSGGWTVLGNQVSNTSVITFTQATGGSDILTHFGIGTDFSGAGSLLFSGSLTNSLNVSNGISPIFQATELKVTVD